MSDQTPTATASTAPTPTRAALELTGEEIGLVRDLLAAHADRSAMIAGQSRRGLDLLRGCAPLLSLCATVEAAIAKLPESERPKPPAPPPRVRE